MGHAAGVAVVTETKNQPLPLYKQAPIMNFIVKLIHQYKADVDIISTKGQHKGLTAYGYFLKIARKQRDYKRTFRFEETGNIFQLAKILMPTNGGTEMDKE